MGRTTRFKRNVRFTFDEVKKTVKAKINMDLDDVIIKAPIIGVLENVVWRHRHHHSCCKRF